MPQKPGDVCENCRVRWEKKQLEPKVLQRASGTTMNKKFLVPLCEYCDGPALSISQIGNHEPPMEA